MAATDILAEARSLLKEYQRDVHALPTRLRILNVLTYTLDMVYIQAAPQWIAEARKSAVASARLRQLETDSQDLLSEVSGTLQSELLPALFARGCRMKAVEECSATERTWLDDYFRRTVRPLLTPLAVDAGRPFPQISAHSLNLLAVLQHPNRFDVEMPIFARLKVPRKVPRLIAVPAGAASVGRGENCAGAVAPDSASPNGDAMAHSFVLSEDTVRANVETLFPGMSVTGVYQFRILRGAANANGGPVGRHTALARQKAWPVVRLDVERGVPDWVLSWLLHQMEATDAVVLQREAPLGVGSLALEWAELAVRQH